MQIFVAAVLAAFAVSAAAPADAAPRKPRKCTPKMIYADWYDGQLETAWPAACIRAAIRNAPEDMVTYGDLPEDLELALARAIRANRNGGGSGNRGSTAGDQSGGSETGGQSPSSTGSGPSSGGTGSGGPPTPSSGPDTPASSPAIDERPSSTAERTLASAPKRNENLFEKAANKLGPGTADSVPLPLILLASLALILLATAAASLVARRVQARRVRVVETAPAGPPERPLEP